MKRKFPWASTFIWVLVSFVTLFPIYWLFVISVKPAVELFSTPDLLLESLYWNNYVDVLNDRLLRSYMVNSLVISSGNAVLSTVLGFFAVYALSRFSLGGKESASSSGPSPTGWRRPRVFLLPLFLLLTQVYRIGDFTLLDTRIGMIWSTPFNIVRDLDAPAHRRRHPQGELDEAAYVDSASAWKVITEVVSRSAVQGSR
ncbi:MAG: hypothetical protein R3D80_18570 [Paracoccaceae bacterium]